jgi:glycosyltransferase involved in cell wall biosynthesis
MQRPTPVLFLNHTAALGGGEIALLHLVAQLDRGRYVPSVLLFANGPLAERMRELGADVHVIPAGGGVLGARKDGLGGRTLLRAGDASQAAKFCVRLAAYIRRSGTQIVHTNSLKADVLGGAAARLARVPLVWHVRDRIADDYLPPKIARAFRTLARIIPHRVIANSHATRATLITEADEGSAFARRVRVVHDGTILAESHYSAAGDEARAGNPGPLIGLVGRITRWKGQHVFLRAAARVREQFPRARFQVIGAALFGEQAYELEVRALAAKLQLGEVIEFTGFRTDVRDLIARLDVLVHASVTGEPFGQVVIEGMAAGRPVVATDGGGIPEIVEDGRTGLLVAMGNDAAMAAAICRLLEDPVKAALMGQAGRQRVEEMFTVDRTAAGVAAVFDELLGTRTRAGRSARWKPGDIGGKP